MVVNFHKLYQMYAQDVYRFAYWLCGNPQDAEDITSETFVRALISSDKIEAKTVKGYLLTIARNLAYKKSKREKRFVSLSTDLPEYQPQPPQLVEESLYLQTAIQFIQTLPESDRTALVLRLQNEMTYEEIATMLDISLVAVRVKVHRARLKLTEYMHQQEEL